MLQITDSLWLCPHAAWGSACDKKGAVEEARRLLALAGGYDAVAHRVEAEEAERERLRKERAKQRRVRYDA